MTAPANTDVIQALDSAHFLHPFTDHKALAQKGARVITHGRGIYVWDSKGQKILDAMSGLWCVNVGYGQRQLADAAYRQLMTLPFYNAFFQTTTEPAVHLAARLSQLAPAVDERRFEHVFYSSSGSESNDTNVRLVRRYWDLMGQPERKVIIGRINGYHGSTLAGASLGGMQSMHEQGDLPIADIEHIDQPYFYEKGEPGESSDAFGRRAAGWLETKIKEIGAHRVAAFIAEPVQGAGGVIIPPITYWPEIQRIVDKYGILLISDEVICAFGRLGHWFAYEKFGYKPDLITFAKAVTSGYVPLGGVMVGNRVAQVLIEKGGEFNHGYTYSGHPVACSVALANLDLMEKLDLPNRVRGALGGYFANAFVSLQEHPLVGIAESCGFVAGLLLVRDKSKKTRFDEALEVGMICRRHCFDNGLIMRAVGDRMIIAPPLIMSQDDIDVLMGLISKALDLTLTELKQRSLF